jgi:hypothetical protein
MTNEEKMFEAQYNVDRILLFVFLAIVFVVLGIFNLLRDSNLWILYALLIFLWGHLALLLTFALMDKRKALQIDQKGIRWRPYSEKKILWGDIKKIERKKALWHEIISIELKNPSSYPLGEGHPFIRKLATRLIGIHRWIAKLLSLGDVQLRSDFTDASIEAIMEEINLYKVESETA